MRCTKWVAREVCNVYGLLPCPSPNAPLLAGAACLCWCVTPASYSWQAEETAAAAAAATALLKEEEEGRQWNNQQQRNYRYLIHAKTEAPFRHGGHREHRHKDHRWQQKKAHQALVPAHHYQVGSERPG